ncbi:UbiD-like decarboxylase [Streptomyces albospinus]|uniref:Pyrrole-2-carboxylic acid decarboxylase n=2 Tax=Streptomyces albospinus TaxID=285515 RepID=A0ABQ2V4M2_9ACTN|nr:UbiD-like decarboxylase [Streptomyces albospinus]
MWEAGGMQRPSDLREYIAALRDRGDVVDVRRRVDPHLELGAIIRRSYETRAPAPLFTSLEGVAPGRGVFGAPAALSSDPEHPFARVALSLGLPVDASGQQIVAHIADARMRSAIAPVEVATGPCKENVLLGAEASLEGFPTPLLHGGDGGRYVNTWGAIVARTPGGDFTSWSIARIMMIDGKRMTGLVSPGQHVHQVWQQWAARGEPMPYALVQGGDPALPFVTGMPLPDGVEEAGFLGALTGRPVEVVRCETVDLMVPANAEIVIEGHLSPTLDAHEGPMGEFTGYIPARGGEQPCYAIEAITYRDDPLWPHVVEGQPVDEFHTAFGIPFAAELLAHLRGAGLPITTVWSSLESANHWTAITVPDTWRETLPGTTSHDLVERIADALSSCRASVWLNRTFVLDDDIDPADAGQLTWALATRWHPTQGHHLRTGPIVPLLACYTETERAKASGPKALYDCLLPPPDAGRLRRSSFAHCYPQDLQRKVIDQWTT